MMEYLVLRLPESPGDDAHWIVVAWDGARIGAPGAGTLAAAAEVGDERRVIAIVPGAEVLTTAVDIPVRGAKLAAALPYALEEQLAEDVDRLHFAPGERAADGRIPVAVTSRANMDRWLAELDDAGITPHRLVAEQHCLARVPGIINMLIEGDRLLLNDGSAYDLLLDGIAPGEALQIAGLVDDGDADEEETTAVRPRHLQVYCDEAAEERYRHEWTALEHEFESVDVKLLPDGALPRLAATAAASDGVNLLCGQYAPKSELGGVLAPWRHAAMLLLGLVLLATAGKALEYVSLSREEAALNAQFHEEYRAIVPGAPDVNDPIRLVQSLRARASGGEVAPQTLLQMMHALAGAIGSNSDVQIEAISFRGGVADIRVSAASVSVLDNIRQRIDGAGRFQARIQSADQSGDRVNSRLQIQEVDS